MAGEYYFCADQPMSANRTSEFLSIFVLTNHCNMIFVLTAYICFFIVLFWGAEKLKRDNERKATATERGKNYSGRH
jgi:hypothetical protein